MKDFTPNTDVLQDNITNWARTRGIFSQSSPIKQWGKLLEEVLETRDAILHDNSDERRAVLDGIGDCLVCLTNLAEFYGWTLNQALEQAWIEIADRKGKMINGVFVKEA